MPHAFEVLAPMDIEKRSFDIIESELPHPLDPALAPIIKRVIHTTADFDFADSLYFSPDAVRHIHRAFQNGVTLITDTNMAMAGINKSALTALHAQAHCFMSDPAIAQKAKANGTTRAREAMLHAASLPGPLGFVIGNAPTALIALKELMDRGALSPAFIIGVPVGFVNVVESKELIKHSDTPCILALGRKGGSNVAAAIVNALMYLLHREQ